MIYSDKDFIYEQHILSEVRKLMGDGETLILEYYDRVDNPRKFSHILKGLKIYVYKLDRESATPHIHLVDDNVEIEVSLIDWRIVNVKRPKNTSPDWSSFSYIKDRFFTWLYCQSEEKKNYVKLFDKWNENNPDNQLTNIYLDDNDTSNELKEYLESHEDEIPIATFKRKLYGILSSLFANKEDKNKLINMDTISILREIGMFDEYHLSEKSVNALKVAEDVIKDIKIWFFYI